MIMAKNITKELTTVPNSIGVNTKTLGLALFVIAVTTATSFVVNRYDNAFTRNLGAVRAGQTPTGI